MKDYLTEEGFKDLFICLGAVYGALAQTFYEQLKDYTPDKVYAGKRELEWKFIKLADDRELDDWFKMACDLMINDIDHIRLFSTYSTRPLYEFHIEPNFVDEPEVRVATNLFRAYRTDTRGESISVDGNLTPFLSAVIEFKLISILFKNFNRICNALDEISIFPNQDEEDKYSLSLICLGAVAQMERYSLIPSLKLNKIEKGRNKGTQATIKEAQRKVEILAGDRKSVV